MMTGMQPAETASKRRRLDDSDDDSDDVSDDVSDDGDVSYNGE